MSATPDAPYRALDPLSPGVFRRVWLDTIFDDYKWDPQIGDVSVLTEFPLVMRADVWRALASLAERLAAEALAAEAEILARPALHPALSLPRAARLAWRRPDHVRIGTPEDVRIIRFDFHHTTEGWRISEANIDTPGGLIESGGFTRRMLAHYPGMAGLDDPAEALAAAIRARLRPGAQVALIHATAYSDDRQMMQYLRRALEANGLACCLISPAQVRWEGGAAFAATDWEQGRLDYLIRFFPAEWLPNLPHRRQWRPYFDSCRVPASNPTSALLVQSKRFPLVWDALRTPLPTWRALLPETRDPREVPCGDEDGWVYKPVFSRAGDGISMAGVTPVGAWKKAPRQARRWHSAWIAQRRFRALPFEQAGTFWYPSLGVYTVDGRAAGIYARMATQPLIDDTAKDIAVFLDAESESEPALSSVPDTRQRMTL